MEYDFSTLSADQIEKLAKRLTSINKSFINEYKLAMNVINSQGVNDHYDEVMNELKDIFSDQVTKCESLYVTTLGKVHQILRKYL